MPAEARSRGRIAPVERTSASALSVSVRVIRLPCDRNDLHLSLCANPFGQSRVAPVTPHQGAPQSRDSLEIGPHHVGHAAHSSVLKELVVGVGLLATAIAQRFDGYHVS